MKEKTKILFVCHGNICRSPMAEFVMKHLVNINGLTKFYEIASAAVSTEEIGSDLYPPAKSKLREKDIPFAARSARQITISDYHYYDYIVLMDRSNKRWLDYIIQDADKRKVSFMMEWAGIQRDVADPWYTGDFEQAYQDILCGCKAMLQQLES